MIHWSADPILLSLGPLAIRWYGLCWLTAFLLGEFISRRMLKAQGREDVDASTLMAYALFGTILGARLAHCLFYDPTYYLSNPIKILYVWEGGLASHGGVVGFMLGLYLGARRYAAGIPLLGLLDVAAIPAALGGAMIRTGNFINSEILGNPTQSNWGVVFDRVDPQGLPRHPVQLYEAAAYVLVALVLWRIYASDTQLKRRGLLTGWFLLLVFSARLVLEYWKTPQAVYEAGNMISTGQWLSVPFIGLGLVLMWRSGRATRA